MSGENLESVLALFFSNLQRIHKHANSYAHPHRLKHRYTHTMNARTHTNTHTQHSPNSTLLMCEMSRGLISWKHTTEPEETKREGDTQWETRERGEKEEKD